MEVGQILFHLSRWEETILEIPERSKMDFRKYSFNESLEARSTIRPTQSLLTPYPHISPPG